MNGGQLTSLTYYHEMGKQYLSIPEIADTYLQLDDFDLFSAVEETKTQIWMIIITLLTLLKIACMRILQKRF